MVRQARRGEQAHHRIAEAGPPCVWQASSSGAAGISATYLLWDEKINAEAAAASYISKVLFLKVLCDLIGAGVLLWHGDCSWCEYCSEWQRD